MWDNYPHTGQWHTRHFLRLPSLSQDVAVLFFYHRLAGWLDTLVLSAGQWSRDARWSLYQLHRTTHQRDKLLCSVKASPRGIYTCSRWQWIAAGRVVQSWQVGWLEWIATYFMATNRFDHRTTSSAVRGLLIRRRKFNQLLRPVALQALVDFRVARACSLLIY